MKPYKYKTVFSLIVCTLLPGLFLFFSSISQAEDFACEPTRPDILGPFYRPGAVVRSTVGKGYVLKGIVKSAKDCSPVAGSRIEFWLVGPNGQYDDDHRATVVSDREGRYSFESNHPSGYVGRPPHIHIMVSTIGFERLVTQHYPEIQNSGAIFDIVLIPQN